MKAATVLVAVLAFCAGGCAQVPVARVTPDLNAAARCERLYADVDRAVAQAGVADGAAARIQSFPYLRVDRFLASFANETEEADSFAAWVERMRRMERDGRAGELANLPPAQRSRLQAEVAGGEIDSALQRCAVLLTARDLATQPQRDMLRSRAVVPDDYDTWKRIMGLYWFTRIPFSSGVHNYQVQVESVFEMPLSDLPRRGTLVAYVPPQAPPATAPEIEAILARARRNPLGIPEPDGADAERLFAAFAPVWVVDEHDGNDRIGALVLGEDRRADVDPGQPVVYRRFAHTRYRDQVLLQLVYSVWLPARPRSSAFDLLGGHLDGITWRVTLAPDGTPLIYDSIHNCGCYAQFFPTPRARPLPPLRTLDEQAFIPQHLPAVEVDSRIAVRLEAGTHYIQRVLVDSQWQGISYAFAPYDELRSLSDPAGGHHSAFRPDGIIPGSERGERYVFWPMGVREPGAMRQWGRHATAFVGRRHFDEARLMERYFVLRLN